MLILIWWNFLSQDIFKNSLNWHTEFRIIHKYSQTIRKLLKFLIWIFHLHFSWVVILLHVLRKKNRINFGLEFVSAALKQQQSYETIPHHPNDIRLADSNCVGCKWICARYIYKYINGNLMLTILNEWTMTYAQLETAGPHSGVMRYMSCLHGGERNSV